MLEFYDNLFRYWAVGLFILIAVFSLREYGWKLSPSLAALSSLSAASYLLASQSLGLSVFGFGHIIPLFLSAVGPLLIWLFSLSQFEDHFQLTKTHYGVAALYATFYIIEVYVDAGYEFIDHTFSNAVMAMIRFGLLAHMVYVAWQGRADDLLEVRRRFRTLYIILVTIFTATITIIETWFRGLGSHKELYVFQAFAFAVLGMALLWRITKFEHGIILISEEVEDVKPKPKPTPADPTDKHDLKAITDCVEGQQLYLQAGLTVAAVADRVGMPEHRLRRLVNQHMGYRNFADFLNHYRITAAQQQLADIDNRNKQILTIAMDLGYGSLGPFNRAFKERMGLTPSEYRRKALAEIE